MVGSIFHTRDIQRNVLPRKFIELFPSEGHQYGGSKPNRNICYRLINIKTILTYNTITVRIAKWHGSHLANFRRNLFTLR